MFMSLFLNVHVKFLPVFPSTMPEVLLRGKLSPALIEIVLQTLHRLSVGWRSGDDGGPGMMEEDWG